VVAALRSRGLWIGNSPRRFTRFAPRIVVAVRRGRDEAQRTKAALAIWQSAKPAQGTPVEIYLASRGIDLPPPDALRFHAGLNHPSGGIWPAMVALVTRGVDDTPLAIHRTFIARDGQGKALVEPAKMMLGPCRGGVVRLGQPSDVLMVGEGIETCLAATQATGHAAWAALSTLGIRALDLPRDMRDVIVLADGDDPGEAAARDCAWRWKREGRRVRIARPPQGSDFNDMLLRHAPRIEEGAQ
jgi:putative DNA primase/helicase